MQSYGDVTNEESHIDDYRDNLKMELCHLSVGYGNQEVIGDINLSIHEGEIITLIGPNGAGKSTILKTIAKQLEPVKGNVYISGRDISRMSYKDMAQEVALLLTDRVNPELMTVRDAVEMGRYPFTGHMGALSGRDREIVEKMMRFCDISELSNKDFRKLSDGQKQRVLFCRALAQEPKVMILDEPTSYLDIRYKISLLKLLKKLRDKKGMTIIMSLHEFEMAKFISDRIVCVKDDSISRTGTPEEIIKKEVLCELYDLSTEDLAYFEFIM